MSSSKYKESAPLTYYHIYNRGNQKQDIFRDESDYLYYLKKLQAVLEKRSFALICYCLMPNHIHLIVQQRDDDSPVQLIASLHTSYSMHFNYKYHTVGHLFQDRYKQRVIENDDYMKSLIAYIHLNPVKARICAYPKEYQWSSYREYASNFYQPRICDHNLLHGYQFDADSFSDYVKKAEMIDPAEAFDEITIFQDSPDHLARTVLENRGTALHD